MTANSKRPAPVWAIQANAEAAKVRAAQRIEDTEELLSWGRSVEEIAERVGFPSLAAAERYFYRKGRPDLARHFGALNYRNRQAVAA